MHLRFAVHNNCTFNTIKQTTFSHKYPSYLCSFFELFFYHLKLYRSSISRHSVTHVFPDDDRIKDILAFKLPLCYISIWNMWVDMVKCFRQAMTHFPEEQWSLKWFMKYLCFALFSPVKYRLAPDLPNQKKSLQSIYCAASLWSLPLTVLHFSHPAALSPICLFVIPDPEQNNLCTFPIILSTWIPM